MLFSVRNDDPFIIFQKLQNIARETVGDSNVIDLSRGDPGYGFTPSVRGREFASFILFLDSVLNLDANNRFINQEKIWERIEDVTGKTYQSETASNLTSMLREFIEFAINAAKEEGVDWTEANILWELFAYSTMSGGSYLNPRGQELSRIIVAAWHRAELAVNTTSSDLILTNGASHAIGAVFKALGKEGCGFLQEGDCVSIASPVYSPYNRIIEERGLRPIPFSIDPITGDIGNLPDEENIKALIVIDPNNPTGFSLSQNSINDLANFAKQKNALVITDEVYSSFFPKKKTMLILAPERTICINARSKVERATGLRFGEIITLPEGRANMANMLGLAGSEEFEQLLLFAKAPGRTGGQFQHTTFVPGPSQLLGIAHIALGGKEREEYMQDLQENRDVFCKELSLTHKGNNYYIIFDIDNLPDCKTKDMPVEERLLSLAKAGVVFIPAYRFFSEENRKNPGILTSMRASVVNTTPDRLREAARRTREVLC